ncbi:Lreu_0056 family protein [Limosilactobacillus pontis]
MEIKDSQNNQIRRKKEVTVRQLVRRFYQTSKQQQQVNELVSELRTE